MKDVDAIWAEAYEAVRSEADAVRRRILSHRRPNPAVRLPAWPWLHRFDRWRCERGILTGRWTQAEIDDIHRRAHEQYIELQKHFE